MSKEELEKAMRKVLEKYGRPQADIDRVVPFLLNQPSLQTDETRQIFFNQWRDEL